MLPYLTDYENDRRLFRPRVVNAILVLMPFMVLYRATELWFGDMYLFDFMKRSQYGLMWFALCLISVYRPRFSLFISYGDTAAIILAQILGVTTHNSCQNGHIHQNTPGKPELSKVLPR